MALRRYGAIPCITCVLPFPLCSGTTAPQPLCDHLKGGSLAHESNYKICIQFKHYCYAGLDFILDGIEPVFFAFEFQLCHVKNYYLCAIDLKLNNMFEASLLKLQ